MIALGLATLSGATTTGHRDAVGAGEAWRIAAKVRTAMVRRGYHSGDVKVDYLAARIGPIIKWAGIFGVPDATDEIVALVVQETKFGVELDPRQWGFGNIDAGSYGVFLAEVRRMGLKGKIDRESLDHQAAFTVAAFWVKLRMKSVKGDYWQAVRRYNGDGNHSWLHLRGCKRWHREIFGRKK